MAPTGRGKNNNTFCPYVLSFLTVEFSGVVNMCVDGWID